jgi:nicotinate-nucleotide adenylyltransferase
MGGIRSVKVGVLGGTFDPIHIGHLIAAEEVRFALALDSVLFAPAGQPPHKSPEGVSPASHRVRMVEVAIASNPVFHLSRVDLDRAGRSYTVETLQLLREQLEPSAEIFFIIGMDSLAEIPAWRDPLRVMALCRLVVVNRPPYPEVNMATLEGELPGISGRVDMVRIPGIDIASSELQARVARGLPIKYQVPEPVERYIFEHGLYSSSDGIAK